MGISQTLEDFVGTEKQPRIHGPGIVKNATTKIIGQQRGDLAALANHLHLNDVVLKEIKGLAPRPPPQDGATQCRSADVAGRERPDERRTEGVDDPGSQMGGRKEGESARV